MMQHAIVLNHTGGPEQLHWQEMEVPQPARGEALIRQTCVGLNYIDTYHRSGIYPLASLPAVIGMEAAGIVEQVGEGCRYVKAGDRVAYCLGAPGAYAQYRAIAESQLVLLPDTMTDDLAAASILKGLTAYYLLHRTFKVNKGHTILVHAAAGGVGLLLCQWANLLGARVIGSVGSPQKADIAKTNGCDYVVQYKTEPLVERVKAITQGKGVHVAYDGVGHDTYTATLDSLGALGMFVSYGHASGPVPLIDARELARRGSLFFTRPSLSNYMQERQDYLDAAHALFSVLGNRKLNVMIGQRYPLEDAATAHRDLEAGKTTGATILTVR
jgi:NADPH2:quinone reductase